MKNRFVPYPFQYNLHRLPEEDQKRHPWARTHPRRTSRQDQLRFFSTQFFGDGLCDLFLTLGNFKVWAHPARLMRCQWTAERVAPVSLERVRANIEQQTDQVSWGPNNTFQFPKQGGTGAIWKSLANQLPADKIRLNAQVARVDADTKTVALTNGQTVRYDRLVSTMPLNKLAEALGDANLVQKTQKLLYSATHIVGIGLEGQPPEHLKRKCWMYFPEKDCPFYRVTVFSNYSPNNTPRPGQTWSLMAEVSESAHKPVAQEQLLLEVLDGMRQTKLIDANSTILSQFHLRLPQGYPVPGLERDSILGDVLPTLAEAGILSRGRFGAWKYEVSNQDHSFMQGVEAVEHLVNGRAELTLHQPDLINHRHNPFPYLEWSN